jgi:hypothetical protein
MAVGAKFSLVGADDDRSDRPVQVAAFHILERECDNAILGAQRGEGFQDGAHRARKAFLADRTDRVVRAHADQQDACGAHTGHAAQQQGGTGLTGDIARLDGRADLAVQVEGFGCLRQFLVLEHRYRHAAGFGRGQRVFCVECFYAKVHLVLRLCLTA